MYVKKVVDMRLRNSSFKLKNGNCKHKKKVVCAIFDYVYYSYNTSLLIEQQHVWLLAQ
jgi:hypothetical protein